MLLAEFESADELARAYARLKREGHAGVEAYSPYAIEELEAFEPRPWLPWIAGLSGFAGAGAAYFVQWYVAAVDYPLDVGERPPHSPLAFVPITFEMGILSAALVTFVLLLRGAGLPRLWRPVFEAAGFERAAVDGFFLQARDEARSALLALGARSVVAFSLVWLLLLPGCDFQRMTVQMKSHAELTPPEGTVAQTTNLDERSPPVTLELLRRGRERFGIYCAACHGVLGDADTVVADRMCLRRPRSLLDEEVREKAPSEIYLVIAKGYGLMPSYSAQLPVADRWAIAHYVRSLQLSQSATLDDLPASVRSEALEAIR